MNESGNGLSRPDASHGDRRLRVLLLLHQLDPGAPSVPIEAFENLRDRIDVLTIALRDGRLRARCEKLGPLVILPEWRPSLLLRIRRRLAVEGLRGTISRFSPDLLYVNSVAALEEAHSLPLPKKPVLLHVHELDSLVEPALRSWPELLLSWPDRYIAVSDCVRQFLVDVCGIPASKVACVHEFVGDQIVNLVESIRKEGSSQSKLVIGGAGFPAWRKGISLWLQVAASVKRLLPEGSFECRWVGAVENQHLRLLQLEARKLGVEEVVRFLPSVADPYPHYAAFDVFAMTSWEDPCPLVVLENMALGKVVVCFSGGGGAPEVVGDAGIMIPEFNTEWMAEAIACLAAEPARRSRLGDSARHLVAQRFVSSVQSPKILAEIRRTAGLENSGLEAAQVTGV